METVTSWGEAFMTSMSGALMVFMAALPKILGFAVILIVGWFIAGLIAKGIAMLLRKVNFNQLAERAGIASLMQSMGTDAARIYRAQKLLADSAPQPVVETTMSLSRRRSRRR